MPHEYHDIQYVLQPLQVVIGASVLDLVVKVTTPEIKVRSCDI